MIMAAMPDLEVQEREFQGWFIRKDGNLTFQNIWFHTRGDRGGDKEAKTESSPLEEAQAGPVATDDVRIISTFAA